jgi:hypothetical protein
LRSNASASYATPSSPPTAERRGRRRHSVAATRLGSHPRDFLWRADHLLETSPPASVTAHRSANRRAAVGRNPLSIIVARHRVVGSKLTGYAGKTGPQAAFPRPRTRADQPFHSVRTAVKRALIPALCAVGRSKPSCAASTSAYPLRWQLRSK